MDHSVCNMKAILAVAVLAMAAFAGVMIVGDDADAAVPTYKVTYKFGESVIVDKTSAETEGQYSFTKTPSAMGFAAPTGYAFDLTKWKDANSGAIYSISADSSVKYTFSADVVVEPIVDVANDKAVIVLTDGNVSERFILSTPYEMAADTPGFADCLKALGLKADSTGNIVIDKTGFRFDGFYLADSTTPIKTIAGLDGEAGKEITFTAKYTPVYDISFVVEDVTITTLASDKLADETGKYIIPVAPAKENHVFTAWVDEDGNEVITFTAGVGYKPVASELKFTEDTVLYAAFTPDNMTVTFVVGEFTSTQTVLYGALAMKPELPVGYVAWVDDKGEEFNFNTPIKANITLTAKEGEPVTVYTVTFEIDGKAPVTQRSDSMVLPDTTIEGKVFQGWVVKGGVEYVNPMTYEIINDMTFVAVYKTAVATAYTVTFEIDGKAPVTQRADSLAIPDVTREGFNFQGWVVKGESKYVNPMTYDITEDITFVAVYKEADPPAGPSFFETTEGKCVAVLIAVVIIAFVYAVYSNMFGLKDALTSVKITRVKK